MMKKTNSMKKSLFGRKFYLNECMSERMLCDIYSDAMPRYTEKWIAE